MRLARPRSQWLRQPSITHCLITHPESHLWCSRGDDESRGHTELGCLFHRMPAEMRQTSRNKEAVRHYSFQSNLTSQGRWFIMVITRRLTLAGEQRAVPEMILEHRCQIWQVMAMMSSFAHRRPFWSCTANEGRSELDEWPVNGKMQNRLRLKQPIVRWQVHNCTNSHQWPEIWVTPMAQQQTTKYKRIQSKKKMCRWVNLVLKKT